MSSDNFYDKNGCVDCIHDGVIFKYGLGTVPGCKRCGCPFVDMTACPSQTDVKDDVSEEHREAVRKYLDGEQKPSCETCEQAQSPDLNARCPGSGHSTLIHCGHYKVFEPKPEKSNDFDTSSCPKCESYGKIPFNWAGVRRNVLGCEKSGIPITKLKEYPLPENQAPEFIVDDLLKPDTAEFDVEYCKYCDKFGALHLSDGKTYRNGSGRGFKKIGCQHSQIPASELKSCPLPGVLPKEGRVFWDSKSRCRMAEMPKTEKTPFELADMDFLAAMCDNFQEGLTEDRVADGWKELDFDEVFPEYQAKLLRHFHGFLKAHAEGDSITAKKELAAVSCNANVLWHHI